MPSPAYQHILSTLNPSQAMPFLQRAYQDWALENYAGQITVDSLSEQEIRDIRGLCIGLIFILIYHDGDFNAFLSDIHQKSGVQDVFQSQYLQMKTRRQLAATQSYSPDAKRFMTGNWGANDVVMAPTHNLYASSYQTNIEGVINFINWLENSLCILSFKGVIYHAIFIMKASNGYALFDANLGFFSFLKKDSFDSERLGFLLRYLFNERYIYEDKTEFFFAAYKRKDASEPLIPETEAEDTHL